MPIIFSVGVNIRMSIRTAFLSFLFLIASSVLTVPETQAQGIVAIDSSFSASWFNPEESGHGVMIHLIDETTAWLCWFAFDLDSNPAWICALGTISGDTIQFDEAFTIEGGTFPPEFDPDLIVEVAWGSITIVFTGCNSGLMTWTTNAPGFVSGSMPLSRLTTLWDNECDVVQQPTADFIIPRTQSMPTINGVASSGEWDDAVVVNIVVNGQWTVPVSLMNDGNFLYVLFSNVSGPNDENRVNMANQNTTFPEIFIDRTPADAEEFDDSVYWFHASFQDCFLMGRFAQANNCGITRPLWSASNWPLGVSGDHTEIAITYERLDLTPGQSHLIGVFATMTSSLVGLPVYHNWPAGSDPGSPDTWSIAELE